MAAAAVSFRPATKEDVPALLWLIQVRGAMVLPLSKYLLLQLLAEDEKEPHAVKIGKEGE